MNITPGSDQCMSYNGPYETLTSHACQFSDKQNKKKTYFTKLVHIITVNGIPAPAEGEGINECLSVCLCVCPLRQRPEPRELETPGQRA